MPQENFDNEQTFRRFLLGLMAEEERSLFEERFVADEDVYAQLRVVEDELIESYARGFLSETDKKLFEKNFLTTRRRRERLNFTESMLGTLAAKQSESKKTSEQSESPSSVWQSVSAFFAMPSVRYATAFALLLIIAFAVWLLVRKPKNEMANQNAPKNVPMSNPTPQLANKEPDNDNARQTANNNKKTPNTNQSPQPLTIAAITLIAGGSRSGGGSMPQLSLSKETRAVRLQLTVENNDYKTYSAEILNAEGEIISRSRSLKIQKTIIAVTVPANALKNGDYIVKLYGQSADGASESVASYSFRVVRK